MGGFELEKLNVLTPFCGLNNIPYVHSCLFDVINELEGRDDRITSSFN